MNLKQHLTGFATFCLVLCLAGCSLGGGGSDTSPVSGYSSAFPGLPEADSAYNTSSAGLYRGGLVGSTGCFQIYLEGSGYGWAYLCLVVGSDEYDCSLSTTYFNPGQPGEEYAADDAIVDAVFTGTLEGTGALGGNACTLTFSVDGDGSNPEAGVTVDTHAETITASVVKETSSRLVMQYTGIAYYPEERSQALASLFVAVSCEESLITVEGWLETMDDETYAIDGTLSGVTYSLATGLKPLVGKNPLFVGSCRPIPPGDPEIDMEGTFDAAQFPDLLRGTWSWSSAQDSDQGEWTLKRDSAPGAGSLEPGFLGWDSRVDPPSLTQPGGFFAELSEDKMFWGIFAAGDDPDVDQAVDGGRTMVDPANPGTFMSDHVPTLKPGFYDVYGVIDVDGEPGVSENDFIGEWKGIRVFSGKTTTISWHAECISGKVTIDPQIVGDEDVFHLQFGLFKWEQDGRWFNSMNSHGWTVTGPGPHSYLVAGPADEPGAHYLMAFIEALPGNGDLNWAEYCGFYGYADLDAAMAGGPNVTMGGELLDSYDLVIDQLYMGVGE